MINYILSLKVLPKLGMKMQVGDNREYNCSKEFKLVEGSLVIEFRQLDVMMPTIKYIGLKFVVMFYSI